MNKKIILNIVVCLVVAGVSFWCGMTYGNTKSPSGQFANRTQNGFGQNGGQRTGIGMRGGSSGFVSGEIISKDDTSITVKENNGGSKIIFISPATKIEKTVDGIVPDLIIGKTVTITGAANSDGSINSTSVQLRSIPIKDIPAKQ